MDFYRIFASSYRLTNIFCSKNIKKILLFVLIGVILFLVFSNNAFAYDEQVEVSLITNVSASNVDGVISTGENYSRIFYFATEDNYKYTITNNQNGSLRVNVSTNVPNVGVAYNTIATIPSGESYSFVGNSGFYFSYVYTASDDSNFAFNVTRTSLNKYENTVSDFTQILNVSNLWEQFGFAVPLIGVAVLFAIGFFVVRKVTKGESKAKVKF